MKITFLGAGSTVFARNVLGDCMGTEALRDAEMALYDINAKRLEESKMILQAINDTINEGRARIVVYHGLGQLEAALRAQGIDVPAATAGPAYRENRTASAPRMCLSRICVRTAARESSA